MVLIYSMIIIIFLALFLFLPDIIKFQDEGLSLEVRAVAANKVLTLHSRVWPAVITLICILGLHSLLVFHRFVGPLYRFRWAFEKVRNGDLNFQVKLREKDYLRQEEKVLNEMIEILNGKLGSIQLASQDALKSLTKLEQRANDVSNWTETDKELLGVHRQHLDKLMETTRYFRLEKDEQGLSGPGA
jgi:methyl-accepting chemotaxis protein